VTKRKSEASEGGHNRVITVEMAWHLYKWGDAVEVIEPATLKAMVASFQNSRITVLP
jgi:predicted DNA-binding transcriptional regulator YafY